MRLLACDFAVVLRSDGKTYSPVAGATPVGPMMDMGPSNLPIDLDQNFPSRAIVSKSIVHLPDWSTIELPPHERHIREALGLNSALYLPLLRGDTCLGVLVFGRNRACEFPRKEIALAESFRDQAVIAIENTRLFEAEQARTAELKESLEQQTATSEVLGVISRSKFDLQPVLDTLVASAAHLCNAPMVAILVQRDGHLPGRARHGFPRKWWRRWAQSARVWVAARSPGGRSSTGSRFISPTSRRTPSTPSTTSRASRGRRSMLGVPLLRDGRPVGLHLLYRTSLAPFTRQADRADRDLRRPGRDRHREHAAVRGGAGAHGRADRVARTSDGDQRGAGRHQSLADGPQAGIRRHRANVNAPLRHRASPSCSLREGSCSFPPSVASTARSRDWPIPPVR